jgi:hypothetical protein
MLWCVDIVREVKEFREVKEGVVQYGRPPP